jgi:hypothetical protein
VIERLGFAAVFWAAAGCALLSWACAAAAERALGTNSGSSQPA